MKPATLDCKRVDVRLSEIKRTAESMRKMLANADTGRDFANALRTLQLQAECVSKEVYGY